MRSNSSLGVSRGPGTMASAEMSPYASASVVTLTTPSLMSFLGLVPAESSTGDTIRRKGLTLAGNRRARRALVEAAWTYRYPARVSDTLRARLEDLPKPVRDIAWKAQVRLRARYRRLSAMGKKLPVVVAAIAREMAAFLWAIGREVAPA
jgi:transposase